MQKLMNANKLIKHRILKRKKCSDFYGELLKE